MIVRICCLAAAISVPGLMTGLRSAQAQDAPPASLLFSPSEASALAAAIRDLDRPKPAGMAVQENHEEPEVPNIFVSGLAYYGDGGWTVWANGYRVSPGHQPPLFTVVSVSEEKAEIAIGGSKPAHVTLRPYQTWRSRTNDVVEGIVP